MAFITADRIKETTTVTGTGPITLLGAVSGYRPFSSVMLSIGDTCPYAIVNANASQWEVGIATYTDVNTLTRTTIHASTADPDTDPVDFTAGVKDVFLAPTARTVLSDLTSNDGTVTLTKVGPIVDLSVAIAAATENVIVQVRNTTGATLTKGTVVYINNAIGQIPTVAKALATSDATSAQTLGMISADLGDNDNGYVTIIGLIDDVDTKGYAAGTQLYLSGTVPGEFTNVKPYAPIHLVYVGVVERATVHGKIFVKVQNGYEMDELHNVDAYNPSNGDLLIYNTSTNLWTHSPQSSLTVAPSQVTGTAVITTDSRLSDSRTPTGSAGGVLAGTYPNPSFASTTGTGSVVLSNAPTLTTATLAAGTITTSQPNTITQTWNNAAVTFQALVVNATNNASATLSSLIDLQVGGSSKFSVLKDGRVFYGPNVGVIVGSGMQWYGGSNASSFLCEMTTGGFGIGTNSFFGWTSRNSGIYQPVDHTYEFRGGTNPQSLRIYNTYTDASNYERLGMGWSGNVGYIGMERAGTGSQRYVIVDLGGNPSSGANSIRTVSTNVIEIWAGNTCSIRFGGNTAYIDYFQYYGAGAIKPSNYGISSAGNANRVADKFVFRALGGGTGNTATTYIGFGAAYVPAGIASTASHTQEDCFLVRLLASATPIVAFGSDFLSTVPAIKRTGTRLISRLADDSGYATWEGPLNSNTVNAIALPSAATVTAASGDGTTITYTAANTFSVGQIVSVTGLTTTTGSSLNIANMTIATASSTQFTVANTTVGTAAATQAGTATIQSAGNSLTLTAGSASGTGAGGSLILQAGLQATSGGDGKVIVKQTTGQTSYLQEWQNSSGSTTALAEANGNLRGRGFFDLSGSYGLDLSTTASANIGLRANTSGGYTVCLTSSSITIPTNALFGFSPSGPATTTVDLSIYRDAADTLAQRRSTNAQTFRLYNTYTDASNYERLGLTWASNVCTIGLAQAGTGATRNLVIAGATATTGAGGDVTITAGNGSGVGAGGNIILQPGAQGTSGGNGTTIVKSSNGTTQFTVSENGVTLSRFFGGFLVTGYGSYNGPSIIFRNNSGAGAGGFCGIANGIIELQNTASITEGCSLSYPSYTVTLSTNQNDYSLKSHVFNRINCTAACAITGIAPSAVGGSVHADGRMIRVYNVGTANLTLSHNSASSAAANRFYNATGADIILAPNDYAELIYDATSNGSGAAGWRVS